MPKKKITPNTDNDLINTERDIARVDPRIKYQTAEELHSAVNEYEELCISRDKLMTLSGLIYHLGISHDTWADYFRYPHLCEEAKRAKLMIEASICEFGLRKNSTFAIFYLKSAFGYIEKVDPQQNLNINVTLSEDELDQRLRNAGIDPKSLKV